MKSTHTKEYIRALTALVAARKERQIFQADLAQKLEKPQSFVSKFEGRERRLDVVEFINICRALGANPVRMLVQAGLISDEDIKGAGL